MRIVIVNHLCLLNTPSHLVLLWYGNIDCYALPFSIYFCLASSEQTDVSIDTAINEVKGDEPFLIEAG